MQHNAMLQLRKIVDDSSQLYISLLGCSSGEVTENAERVVSPCVSVSLLTSKAFPARHVWLMKQHHNIIWSAMFSLCRMFCYHNEHINFGYPLLIKVSITDVSYMMEVNNGRFDFLLMQHVAWEAFLSTHNFVNSCLEMNWADTQTIGIRWLYRSATNRTCWYNVIWLIFASASH